MVEILYGLLFALTLFSALMVVCAPHAVYAALYLVAMMLSIAGLFVLMNAQLAAAFQIIVYAGAIMMLFLFVIMLLDIGRQRVVAERNLSVRALGLVFAVTFLIQVIALFGHLSESSAYSLSEPPGIGISTVGRILLTDYVYAYIITSVLLLVAMIGALVMARRHLIQGVYDEDANAPVGGPLRGVEEKE